MKKFNYKTTRNSLLNFFSFNVKEQKNYLNQFERVATNHDLNDREEFAKKFFNKSFSDSSAKLSFSDSSAKLSF